jgi:hypothetical protein
MAASNWTGDDWEAYCLLLIQRRYGAGEVQRVPATHGGDLGIEAFTFDGLAFQCYAAEEPLSTRERYEKQRDKLTVDLAKLESRRSELCALLGTAIIRRYMFMVPIFNSNKLVQHSATKTAEYRAKELPHLDPDFRVVVVTDDDYAETRREVLAQPRQLIDIDTADEQSVQTWMGTHPELVSVANEKLRVIVADDEGRTRYLQGLVTQRLNCENALTALRPRFPDQWETVKRCVNEKEHVLVLEYMGLCTESAQSVSQIAKELQAELEAAVPTLGNSLGCGSSGVRVGSGG